MSLKQSFRSYVIFIFLPLNACSHAKAESQSHLLARAQNVGSDFAPENCDIVINGGSTAALAAALSAATSAGAPLDPSIPENSQSNPRPGNKAEVCLLEPTNWPGGQLTAQALSAVDFSWHKFQKEMRSRHNQNKVFFDLFYFRKSN